MPWAVRPTPAVRCAPAALPRRSAAGSVGVVPATLDRARIAIGAIAGLGAVVFYEALRLCTHFFLETLAGYTVPTPAARGVRRFGTRRSAVGAAPGRGGRRPARRHSRCTASLPKPKDTAPTPPSRRYITTPRACASAR